VLHMDALPSLRARSYHASEMARMSWPDRFLQTLKEND
jgi:hypothetical protein